MSEKLTDADRLWKETANNDAFCAKIGVAPIRSTLDGEAVLWRDHEGDYHNFRHAIEAALDRRAPTAPATPARAWLLTILRAYRSNQQ